MLKNDGQISLNEQNTYSFGIIFGSLFLFLALRFASDTRAREAISLSESNVAFERNVLGKSHAETIVTPNAQANQRLARGVPPVAAGSIESVSPQQLFRN